MSTADLERELKRMKGDEAEPSNAEPLDPEAALRYREQGNLPDDLGRTLRLVLHVNSVEDARTLSQKRAAFEPDFHDPPTWRRDGSVPVNVVPLRGELLEPQEAAWWEDPDIAHLEDEWAASGGRVGGIHIPGEYRGFVYKTILSLRASGRTVTPASIAGSMRRWLTPDQADEIEDALLEANHK